MKEWFTNGRKAAIAGCFLVMAVICTIAGGGKGPITYVEYPLYIAGLTSFVNVLFSVILKGNIHFVYNLLARIVAVSALMALMIQATQSDQDVSVMMILMICVVIGILLWVVEAALIPADYIMKKIVLGFVTLLLDGIVFTGVFIAFAVIRGMMD